MRSIGPAGWASHGFFGFRAKTFGNPSGATSGDGRLVPPGGGPENAIIGQLVAGEAGYMLGGFLGATSDTQFTAVRFNTVFNTLAMQADTPVPNLTDGVKFLFFAPANFISSDGANTIASAAGPSVDWTLATNPGGGAIAGPYGLTFDAVNGRVIFASTDTPPAVYTSLNATPLVFAASLVVGASNPIQAIAYKGTGGIVLCVEGGGGAGPQVWKSLNGGLTWAATAAAPFGGNNGNFLGFGAAQWLTLGVESITGALQTSVSSDDGATWSAATTLPGARADGSFTACAAATDGAGKWVVISSAPPPNNYWVSTDDGTSWASPNLFSAQGAGFAGSLLFTAAGQWQAVWFDPTVSFNFLATSADGATWSAGPAIREPT